MARRSATQEQLAEELNGVETVDEVDVPEAAEDEVVQVENVEAEKPVKEKKEPARGKLADGYVTPVGLAHALSQPKDGNAENDDPSNWHYTKGTDGSHAVAPQMVYSYIKNASQDNPYPGATVTDSLGKSRDNVVKLEDGIAWWDRKSQKAAERRQNAAEKAKAKAERAAKGEQETPDVEPTGVVDEAE